MLRHEIDHAWFSAWNKLYFSDDVTTGSVLSTVTVPLVDDDTCDAKYDGSGLKASKIPEGVIGDWSICAKSAEKEDYLVRFPEIPFHRQ